MIESNDGPKGKLAMLTVSANLHYLGWIPENAGDIIAEGMQVPVSECWELCLLKQQQVGREGQILGLSTISTLLPVGLGPGAAKLIYVKPVSWYDVEENGQMQTAQGLIDNMTEAGREAAAKNVGIELAKSLPPGLKAPFKKH
jgi:hypothetical protein